MPKEAVEYYIHISFLYVSTLPQLQSPRRFLNAVIFLYIVLQLEFFPEETGEYLKQLFCIKSLEKHKNLNRVKTIMNRNRVFVRIVVKFL